MKKFFDKFACEIIAVLSILTVVSMCLSLVLAQLHMVTFSQIALIVSMACLVLMVAFSGLA
jgi:hypothetical protein